MVYCHDKNPLILQFYFFYDSMAIQACPRCGSKEIKTGTMGSGVTFGVTSWNFVCDNCGYRGQPLNFENEKKYQNFLQGLKKEASKEEPSEDFSDDSLKDIEDEEFQKIVKEAAQDTSPLCDTHPFEHKRWWPEFIISTLVAISITVVLFLPNFRSYMDPIIASIYTVLTVIFWILISMLLLVLIEYVGVLIKRNLCQEKRKKK